MAEHLFGNGLDRIHGIVVSRIGKELVEKLQQLEADAKKRKVGARGF